MRAEKLAEVAAEFDRIHSIQRAVDVGSVDAIISVTKLRPRIIDAIERGSPASTALHAAGVNSKRGLGSGHSVSGEVDADDAAGIVAALRLGAVVADGIAQRAIGAALIGKSRRMRR